MAGEARLPSLRVILVEDSPCLREVVAGMLGEIEGVALVGAAGDETAAIRLLDERPADLVIIDLELPSGSGFGVLAALTRLAGERPRAVVFSNHDHPQLRERCRRLGAERFFNKAGQLDEMLDFLLAARSCY